DLRQKIREGVKKADAAAAGPGLGKNRELVMPVLLSLSGKKLLLDADALNYLAQEREADTVSLQFSETALTPHSGEMARLIGKERREVENDRFQALSDAVRIFRACCLLKGQNTLISDAEGTIYVNPTGNAGLGRAGSGDTLTGIAGAMLAQGMNAFEALYSAAWIHGRAGDLCREDFGIRSYLPEDVTAYLPRVFAELEGKE
ncbi:MAG: NAD(P)H-hydrate dehydratase, partial [Lachnospiraceae bacterium]|nr:NAD(P)H-hydrate dehydratase [Lachnospiraceae bacterium]